MTRAAKWVLLSTLIAGLAAYGPDCLAMGTPEQAMQCCNTMGCHSHSQHSHASHDCCTTARRLRAALGQPSTMQAIPLSPVALSVVQEFADSPTVESSCSFMATHSHDPPYSCSTPVPSLRI